MILMINPGLLLTGRNRFRERALREPLGTPVLQAEGTVRRQRMSRTV